VSPVALFGGGGEIGDTLFFCTITCNDSRGWQPHTTGLISDAGNASHLAISLLGGERERERDRDRERERGTCHSLA